MKSHAAETNGNDDLRDVIRDLTARMERAEELLGVQAAPVSRATEALVPPTPEVAKERGDALEFAVGQNWFSLIGIVVLAIGMAFLLSLPFAGLPSALPSLAGYVICGLMFLLARIARRSFETISKYLRGAGMLLLFFATLRLFYFGEAHALETSSLLGRGILLAVLSINLGLAWRRDSPPLFILALITGYATAVAVDSTGFTLGMITVLSGIAIHAQLKKGWRTLAPITFLLWVTTYVIWAIGNPLVGNELALQKEVQLAVFLIPLWLAIYSVGTLFRPDLKEEDAIVQITGIFICGIGFAVFFLHNLLALDTSFVTSHLLTSATLLALAVVFWVREESWFSTFVYAMTGYMALSLALIKAFEVPDVFVSLSLQSLVVIGTAIYFRSPFIIVANCLIFVGIIVGYVVVTGEEQGMSIGFGVVALISARVLNWQRERLTLKTDMMRIAYLGIAFLVFPYALYFLVPETFIAVSWVGIALFYYGMNLVIQNRKYRWMGHMTLILTALYVLVIGTSSLDSHYRIITFFILGTIMMAVSLAFTIMRRKRQKKIQLEEGGR